MTSDKSLGEVLRELFRTYRLEDKLNETRLISSWSDVAGKLVDRHTKKLYIKNRILYVRLDSPALRNELTYSREKLIRSLNEVAGLKVIDDIVFN